MRRVNAHLLGVLASGLAGCAAEASIEAQPVADAGPDRAVAVGEAAILEGRAHGASSPTFTWRQVGGPAAALTAQGNLARVVPASAGTHVLALVVEDGGVASAPDYVTVTARACAGADGCGCEAGESRACYGGPPGTDGVGLCRSGLERCVDGGFGACDGEVRPAPEDCASSVDADCDGLAGCADPDCAGAPGCGEDCAAPGDEDGDGVEGCADEACQGFACDGLGRRCRDGGCLCPGAAELCGVAGDEDCDGSADCADADCAADVACAGAERCDDGADDDGDGLADCADPGCDGQACGASGLVCAAGVCSCPGGAAEASCGDGLDEDCDGLADCADPGCDGAACGDEGRTCAGGVCGCAGGNVAAICDDGADDDCDGQVDCADVDCAFRPLCCADLDLGSALSTVVSPAVEVANASTAGASGLAPSGCGASGAPHTAPEAAFAWRAPANGRYVFHTLGSDFDTVVYVLDGCGGVELACNDDAGAAEPDSALELDLASGEEVLVVVDGYANDAGRYELWIFEDGGASETDCRDGNDDEGDGVFDCWDPDCVGVRCGSSGTECRDRSCISP